METKDYDICENRLHEIDRDVFPIIVPSLRSIELTVEDYNLTSLGNGSNLAWGHHVESMEHRHQHIVPHIVNQDPTKGNICAEGENALPTPEDPTTTVYPQDTTNGQDTQDMPTERDD
ncbi:hypothetical protein V5O48_018208 [Marasmius crinis-equi]|uniref:Uncharacterized protein n=1 Tax=Marasmius crinis-equi TaxID=585013 RepID=A0ABR3ELW0_9AGAR